MAAGCAAVGVAPGDPPLTVSASCPPFPPHPAWLRFASPAAASLPPHAPPRCPLVSPRCQIMTDPVLAADGMTYERHAISEWLAFK